MCLILNWLLFLKDNTIIWADFSTYGDTFSYTLGNRFTVFLFFPFPFFCCYFFLLSSNVCFTIVCWPPELLSVLLISCFLPSFSFLYHRHPYSCILFLTTCCFLLLFSFILCNSFLLTLCREESFYCTVPITPVKREVEELDTIEEVSRVARLDVHSPPCHFWVLLWDEKVRRLCCAKTTYKPWLEYKGCSEFSDVMYHHFPYN